MTFLHAHDLASVGPEVAKILCKLILLRDDMSPGGCFVVSTLGPTYLSKGLRMHRGHINYEKVTKSKDFTLHRKFLRQLTQLRDDLSPGGCFVVAT